MPPPDLVTQPTAMPTRKMTAVGLSGSAATVLVGAAHAFGLPIPFELAGAIVTVVAAVFGYFTREENIAAQILPPPTPLRGRRKP